MSIVSLIPQKIKRLCCYFLLFLKNYNKKVIISSDAVVTLDTFLEGYNKIGKNTNIRDTYIGRGSYIYDNCDLRFAKIGKFCSIGSNVSVVIGKHPTNTFVSTHPSFFSTMKQAGFTFTDKNMFVETIQIDEEKKYSIKIGNDVWIGFGVTIMEGVTIGDGAIIGTKALVTKDVEPYSINIGMPSKKIGYRFEKDEIDYLLKSKWWDKDFDFLKKNLNLFYNIKDFVNNFK